MALPSSLKVNLALLTAVILWSMSFVAIRLGLEGYSPGSLALFRFGLASLFFLFPYILLKNRPKLKMAADLPLLVVVGTVGIAAYALLLNSGERSVSPGIASFIIAQTPVLTSILAIGFLRERSSLSSFLGILVSCIGIVIIVAAKPIQVDVNIGLFCVALACLCGSMHSIFQKYLLRRISPFLVTAFSTWFATLSLLIFFPELYERIKTASLESTLAVVFLGLVPSTLGQWLWTYGLSRSSVVKASVYLYAMPLLSTLFGWLLLGEVPEQSALAGGLIALCGAAIVKKDLVAPLRAK